MKKFISLSAAIMMGTVLSKQHKHKDDDKAPDIVQKKHKEDFFVTKKDSVESINDPEMFVEIDAQPISKDSNYNDLSPDTSK